MNKVIVSVLAVGSLCSVSLAARADTYSFNAVLSGASELPSGSGAPGTGLATLAYDTHGTASLGDDTYDLAISVFGLTGGTTPGTAASAFHIHAAATVTENGPVLVSLDAAPFMNLNVGSTLLVGGAGVPVPTVPATPASALNAGYPAMSFLDALRGGLTYLNVHTLALPGGEVRGQLLEVSAVPEPSAYAMLLAGVGVIGVLMHRRRRPHEA